MILNIGEGYRHSEKNEIWPISDAVMRCADTEALNILAKPKPHVDIRPVLWTVLWDIHGL